MLDKKFNKYRTLKKFMFIQKQKLAPAKEQIENMENSSRVICTSKRKMN